jgi:hypothetical protein
MFLWIAAAVLILLIIWMRRNRNQNQIKKSVGIEGMLPSNIPVPYGLCEHNPDLAKTDREGENCFNNMYYARPIYSADIQGNDILNYQVEANSDPWACYNGCTSVKDCKAFSFKDGSCFLKRAAGPITYGVANSSVTLAAPHGFCEEVIDRDETRMSIVKENEDGTNCSEFFIEKPGKNFPGNDILDFSGEKKEYCERRCKMTDQCKGYVYNSLEKRCWLKSDMKNEAPDAAFDSGKLEDFGMCGDGYHFKTDPTGKNCSISYKKEEGISHPGNDLFSISDWTAGNNSDFTCQQTPGCVGYDKTGSKSFLKSSMATTKIDGEYVSNTAQNFGFCYNDGKTTKMDASGSNCYGHCENNKSIVMEDALGSNCFGRCPNYDSIFPYKFDESGSNCSLMVTHQSGVSYPGNDIETFPQDDKNQFDNAMKCAKACITDKNCKGVTFKVENGQNKTCTTKSQMKEGVNDPNAISYPFANYGLCPNGKKMKTNPTGAGCYGMCSNKSDRPKYDLEGSNCFGDCPSDAPYKYKQSDNDTCYGLCPTDVGGYKQSKIDTCYGACPNGIDGMKQSAVDDCRSINHTAMAAIKDNGGGDPPGANDARNVAPSPSPKTISAELLSDVFP